MGLDLVEMVMELEDRFGIDIPDAAAERIATTRDVVDFLCSVLLVDAPAPCPTQRAFYDLRRAVASRCVRLRPSTPLVALVPGRRRSAWAGLAAQLPRWHLPELERPPWLVVTLVSLVPVLAIAIGAVTGSLLLVQVHLFVLAWVAILASRPLANRLPRHLGTVGDLIRRHSPGGPMPVAGGWTRERVRAAAREVIREQLGLPADFPDDARFVDDLGFD